MSSNETTTMQAIAQDAVRKRRRSPSLGTVPARACCERGAAAGPGRRSRPRDLAPDGWAALPDAPVRRLPRAQEPRARAGRGRCRRRRRRDVTAFAVGDEVYGFGRGTFAEYAVAPEARLARKPKNLSFEQAAVVPVSAGTALQALTQVARRAARTAGAGHRRIGRRRQLRRTAGEGTRRRSHWRVQPCQARPGARPGCPARARLHHAMTGPTAPTTTTWSSTSGAGRPFPGCVVPSPLPARP